MKELREKRASLIYEMKDLVEQGKKNDGGQMTKDQEERWGKLEAEESALAKQIEVGEKQERLNKEMAEREAERAAKTPPAEEDKEARRVEAFREYLITGDGKAYRDSQAGQNTTTNADGKYTVPQSWASQIETAMLAYGGMLDVATVISTPNGDQINYPICNDTTNKSSIVAEETISTTDTKTFSTLQLNAYTLRTPIIPISLELLQDSAYNMEAYIAQLLAENDARGINYYTTVGTGSNQHNGVVTAATSGKTTASATAFTRNELLDLKHSVDPAYRAKGRWMFNDAVLKAIKKLSIGDSDARPLWQPGIAAGDPATIDGDPYTINQDMSSTITATDKTVLYGDFSKYLIRRVLGYSLFRFNETYMTSLQIGLMGFSRSDGELLDAGTHPIKYMVQAAS